MSVATTNPILEKYGLDKLSDEEKYEVADALRDSIPVEYPNEEWPQWMCDLIDERLRDADENPNDFLTLEEFRQKLKESRT